MDISSLKHKSDSIYSHPVSKDEIELRLLTKKDDDILKVELVYNDKYSFHEQVKTLVVSKICNDGVYDYYIVRIKLKDKRFAYVFKLTLLNNEIYYFSEAGVSKTYDITKGFYNFFQISFINDLDLVKVNKKLQNRIFYQIFVDRFYKDDTNNNQRININWGDLVNSNSIAGGTLRGIKEKLDYLLNLNIDALYLTPIFESLSNHKYDTIDYYKISTDFGDETDLLYLIKEVHEKGMIILLDGVFNHVSEHFFAFEDVKLNGTKSKYYNWFFIDGEKVESHHKNYETFASCKNLPKLNLNNKEVQDYILGVCIHYVKQYDIDGYRLDVSDEIPHAFWIRLKYELKKIKNDIILLGENWHNAHAYLNTPFEFDSIMNYAFTKEVLDFVAYQKNDALNFKNHVISNLFRYKSNVNYNLLNLLSSHDVYRFLNECKHDVDRYLIGYILLYTHIGIPCLYYGDEIGLDGGYDPYNRACFIWDKDKWDNKINTYIKKMIKIHKDEKLNELSYSISEDNGLLIINRSNNKKHIVLLVNLNNKDYKIDIDGQILLSNLYTDNILKNKGFVIYKIVEDK